MSTEVDIEGPFTLIPALAQTIFDFFGDTRPSGRKALLDELEDQTLLRRGKRRVLGPLSQDAENISMCIVYPEQNSKVAAALPYVEVFVVLCEAMPLGPPHQDPRPRSDSVTERRLPPMMPLYAPICGTFLREECAVDRAKDLAKIAADLMDAKVVDVEKRELWWPLVREHKVVDKSGDVAVVCGVKRIEAKKVMATALEG